MSPPTVSTRGAPRLLLRILPPSAVSHGAKPRVRAEMDEIWDIWMFNANLTSYNQESHGYLVCGNPPFNRSTRKWYGSIVATGPAVRRHASQKSHRWRYSPRNLPTEEYLSVLLCVLPQFRYSVRTIIVKAGHLPQGPLEVMLVMAFCFFTTAVKWAVICAPRWSQPLLIHPINYLALQHQPLCQRMLSFVPDRARAQMHAHTHTHTPAHALHWDSLVASYSQIHYKSPLIVDIKLLTDFFSYLGQASSQTAFMLPRNQRTSLLKFKSFRGMWWCPVRNLLKIICDSWIPHRFLFLDTHTSFISFSRTVSSQSTA